ncbi:MAG: hypothetical protein ACLQQ4_12575 [Bacteroidia bacterium]
MGLDMYLTKKFFIGAYYEHRNVAGIISITKDDKKMNINFNKVSYIEENAAYWRKSNQIHKWFVDNIQEGNDDCGTYYVPLKALEDLLDICKKIKADHNLAEKLLPVQEGFFFGSTEYDEYYFQDIDDTIEILEEILKETNMEYDKRNVEFYYHSSW